MTIKQFKIGEYAIGGIIAVEITGKIIQVHCRDFDTGKKIEQPGTSGSIMTTDYEWRFQLEMFLNELTSSYYAEKIMTWIQENVKLHNTSD